MSLDISRTIAPKSEKLNADDLIAGPRTITVTAVKLVAEDQPVAIHFAGDEGKPYKPCNERRGAEARRLFRAAVVPIASAPPRLCVLVRIEVLA